MTGLLFLAVSLTVAASPVSSPLRRFAIVAGSGAPAERDAARMSRALTEVGEVAPADVVLLQGRKVAEVEAAFAKARERIAELHRASAGKALLVFFGAGHGDGASLDLGADKLSYARIKSLLGSSGADARLGIVDAFGCAAAVLSADEAFFTSCAAGAPTPDAAIQGSAFSHNLAAGLRGAADRSGDQRVSLDELVRYAFARSPGGGLRPGNGFRPGAQGEIIVADIKRARTAVELPSRGDLLTLSDGDRGEVLAQLDGEAARVLAVPPGRYVLRARADGQAFIGRFTLEDGSRGALAFDELRPDRPGADAAAAGGVRWTTANLVPIAGEAPPAAPPIGMSVLPFQGTRGDPMVDALAVSITQAISAEVSHVDGVHVFRNNGARVDLNELAKLSGVDVLAPAAREKLQAVPGAELAVMGLVGRTGDLLNATAYLIDVPTGRVLDASHGARPRGSVTGLGDELAREVSVGIRTALERRRPRF